MSSPIVVTINPMGLLPDGIDTRYASLFDHSEISFLKVEGDDTRLYQLVQLGLGSAPFTAREKELFDTARKTEKYSEKWLGVAGYATIIIAPVIATVLSFLPWDEITKRPLGGVEKLSIAVFLASLAVMISAGLGMKYTGTNPKLTSDVQNTDQAVMLLDVKGRFDELSDFMVASYQRDDEPLKTLLGWCARSIVVEDKTALLRATSTQRELAEKTMDRFTHAIRYVREGITPPVTQLAALIRL